MNIISALLLGFIIGSALILLLKKKQQKTTIQEYEAKLADLEIQHIKKYEAKIADLEIKHQQAVKMARNRSIDGSRSVIKGKVAEQLLPILPQFQYLPSDARFIGDPIDYVIFNGYTDVKDNNRDGSNLEVILLDVKTGKASLSRCQQAISRAVDEGRIRFETIRINNFKQQTVLSESPLSHAYSVNDIRKVYPRAYEPWTDDEESKLIMRYKEGMDITALAEEFERKPGGIRSRLKKVGLLK